jgi:hypothetical protein
MNRHVMVGVVMVLASQAMPALAADGAEIVRDSDRRTKSTTEKTLYQMDLIDASGKIQQSRGFALHYKQEPSRESTLFKFSEPPVVQGVALLIVDSHTGINDIWTYLPQTRRVRRIAGAEKSNWFMGTEFTHEDFEDYQIKAYTFTHVREDSCGAKQRCHVVEAVATKPEEREATGYTSKVYWIEQQSLYPIRVDYIGKDGKPAKTLEVTKLTQTGKYWRPEIYEMRNLQNGRMTRLSVKSRELDIALDDYYVSQRYLRTE